MPQKSQVKEHLVFQGWVKLVSWLQSDWIPHGVSLKHPQAALASQNITHIKWNIPPDTKKQKRYNQILTDNAKCLQTFSSPRKHAWLIQIGANPQFWQNGERQEFQTSKHQNLPIYHFQKRLSFAIFLIFYVCRREITIYSLFGSPCITMSPCHHVILSSFHHAILSVSRLVNLHQSVSIIINWHQSASKNINQHQPASISFDE